MPARYVPAFDSTPPEEKQTDKIKNKNQKSFVQNLLKKNNFILKKVYLCTLLSRHKI